MQTDEQQFIEQLQCGDERAFQQLVAQYQAMVYNTCLGLTKNPGDADDLTQEVFIAVFTSVGQFRHEAKITTWLYRIAVTKSLEYIRKHRRRFSIMRWWGEKGDLQVPDFEHPGVLSENKERARVLFAAIDKLPEGQRVAFTLHKLEGLSYENIAEIMQNTLPAVESLMHRARQNLRKTLKKYYYS
jgi:RNA polymerase sigma-70 factor (ECF subfamily)